MPTFCGKSIQSVSDNDIQLDEGGDSRESKFGFLSLVAVWTFYTFLAIFRNEITTILTPSASEGGGCGW